MRYLSLVPLNVEFAMKIVSKFLRFLRDEDGPTAVEYAIMLALIFGVIIASVGTLGSETNTMYEDVSGEVETVMTNATGG